MTKKMIETIEEDEYISVADFSGRAGCSRQAVYKQLNKRLKPYVKEVDGKKMLNIRALREVYGKDVKGECQPNSQPVDQQLTNQLTELLKEQLAEKDRQIEELHRLLATSQMQLTEFQHKVQELEEKKSEEPLKEEKKSWIRRLFGL